MDQLIDIIDYTNTKVKNKKTVIVHCTGGTDGAILSAYLEE